MVCECCDPRPFMWALWHSILMVLYIWPVYRLDSRVDKKHLYGFLCARTALQYLLSAGCILVNGFLYCSVPFVCGDLYIFFSSLLSRMGWRVNYNALVICWNHRAQANINVVFSGGELQLKTTLQLQISTNLIAVLSLFIIHWQVPMMPKLPW